MSTRRPQSYAHHARYVPLYHFVLAALVGIYLLRAVVSLFRSPGLDTLADLVLAAALVLMFAYVRVFPLAVQDRVIRLEERLRHQRLLDPDLLARSAGLTTRQIVGLRFAGDEELPDLVRRALDERLSEKRIKQAVRQWRADHRRA